MELPYIWITLTIHIYILYDFVSLVPRCSFLLSSPTLAAFIRQRFVAHRGRLRFCRSARRRRRHRRRRRRQRRFGFAKFTYLFLYLHLHSYSYSCSPLLRSRIIFMFHGFLRFSRRHRASRPLHCRWAIARNCCCCCCCCYCCCLCLLCVLSVCKVRCTFAIAACGRHVVQHW